jgi:hypothetical protein
MKDIPGFPIVRYWAYLIKDIPGFPIVDIERSWWRIFQDVQSLILSVPDEGYFSIKCRTHDSFL